MDSGVKYSDFRSRFGSGLISTGKAAAPSNVFMPFGTTTLISYTSNTSGYKGTKTTRTTEVTKSSQQSQSKVKSQSKVTSQSKIASSSRQSQSKVTASSKEWITKTASQTVKKEETEMVSTSSFIEEGIREIQKLTAEASGSTVQSQSQQKEHNQPIQTDATTVTTNGCTFGAVDVKMHGSLGVQGRYSVLST